MAWCIFETLLNADYLNIDIEAAELQITYESDVEEFAGNFNKAQGAQAEGLATIHYISSIEDSTI